MAVVTFSKAVSFPIAPMRKLLSQHLSLYKWQCGEDDRGGERDMGTFGNDPLIVGRSSETAIFVELKARIEPSEALAPPHAWRLLVGTPTTELQPIADRATLIICMTAMILDEDAALCQLVPGGSWLTADELLRVFKAVLGGEGLDIAAGLGIPNAQFADRSVAAPPQNTSAPRIDLTEPGFRTRVLPMMLVLADRLLQPDWPGIEEFARELDPDGDWRLVGAQRDVLAGRGAQIIVQRNAEPAPALIWETCLPRSFWYGGDQTALARHRATLSVGTMLDTAATPFDTVRQVAKVMTLVTGMIARLPGAIAVINSGAETIYDPQQVSGFLGILSRDELPTQLWIHTAPHSVTDGNICLSTVGLVPFLGHELEAWNAPLTRDDALTEFSDLIRYLLTRGPVIGHGDTAGRTKGDKAIRCFLGPSRADYREATTPALFLEFEGPDAATPQPDRPTAPETPMSASSEGVLRGFLSSVGGRDDTGMSDIIRGMLSENEAAKTVSRTVAAGPLDPRLAEADRLLAQLKQDADGTSAEAIEAMQGLLRNPPSPDVIASDANPFAAALTTMIRHEQATGALPTPDAALPSGHVATLLLHSGVGLPARDLIEQLELAFPERRWSVNASDQGLNVPRTVTGTGGAGTITARIVAHPNACPEPGVPPHIGHIEVSIAAPDADDARFVATLICACLIVGQDRRAQARLAPGAPWLDYEDVIGRMVAVKHERRAPAAPPPAPQAAAGFGRRVGGFGRKGL